MISMFNYLWHIPNNWEFKSGDLKGHYQQIWKKQNGRYVIYHDEYNMAWIFVSHTFFYRKKNILSRIIIVNW